MFFSVFAAFMVYAVSLQPGNLDVFGGALISWGFWLLFFLMSLHLLFGKTKIAFDMCGLTETYTCLTFTYVTRLLQI